MNINIKTIKRDDVVIEYMQSITNPLAQYIVLIIPFGATFDAANAFFQMLGNSFNIITWKSRHIFDLGDDIKSEALTVDHHVNDMTELLSVCNINSPIVVGYCSGAAIALRFSACSDNYMMMYLVCGEYALGNMIDATSHYQEVDFLLKKSSKGINDSRLISKKINSMRGSEVKIKESDYFNKPYYNPVYLYRYSINYTHFIDMNYLQEARSVSKRTYIYCSVDDEHVGTLGSEKISNEISNSKLIVDTFGDHYAFCRLAEPLLLRLKKDISYEYRIR